MRYCLIAILLILSLAAYPQKQGRLLIDSLLLALPSSANDTVRARIYNRVANYYVDVNTDTAFIYAGKGMQLAQKMQWQKGVSAFHICYGNIFSSLGYLDSCIVRYQQALDISIALKDTVNMSVNYNNLGGVANAKSDFVSAARYFTATLQLGKSTNNTYSTGLACENLSLVYFNQQDYTQALAYARQSLDAYEKGNHTGMKQSALKAIANALLNMKQYDSAYRYYQAALLACRQNDNKMQEATTLNAIANFFSEQKNYEKALQYGLESKKIWDATGPDFEDAITNTGFIGSYYLQLAKNKIPFNSESNKTSGHTSKLLDSAKTFLTDAIHKSRKAGNKAAELVFQQNLAEVYAMSGNYKDAYHNVIHYQSLKDSIYSQENKNKIATAISQLEIDKKNNEITIGQLVIANQHRQRILFIGGLLFLAVATILFYRQSKARKKTNTTLLSLNKKLDQANQLKSRFFAILSHDLRSPVASLISFLQLQKEEPGMMNEKQITDNQQKITVASETLLGNMEAMLLWSKGQMEHFKPVMRPIMVSNLFMYIKDFFATTQNIEFVFCNPDALEICSDENYLRTIMHNLTANAVKALANTPDACITWKAIKEQEAVYLSVNDNGPGIKAGEMKALYSDEPVANKKYGLGLYLVRELCKAIGCNISCDTVAQKGTTFTLSIDFRESDLV